MARHLLVPEALPGLAEKAGGGGIELEDDPGMSRVNLHHPLREIAVLPRAERERPMRAVLA